MPFAEAGTASTVKSPMRTVLTCVFGSVLLLHVILLLALRYPVAPSRLCIAAIPIVAALCFIVRAQRNLLRERIAWRWLSVALLLWASGQIVETFIGHSAAASNLAVDASDFLYVISAFPILLAVSSTRETESIRSVFYLNCAQIALACMLTWVLLYRMQMPPDLAATVMARIYGAECVLLAIATGMRLVTWSTLEEKRRIRLLCTVVWIYLPIELGMDFATRRWNLRAGTLFDLLWSVPFVYAGIHALRMPMDEKPTQPRQHPGSASMLIESLCPALITIGIFLLAASITGQHPVLGLSALLLLLLAQSFHSGAMQVKYLKIQDLLLDREQKLEHANADLQKLTLLDPLTGIANRRKFTSELLDCWRRAIRKNDSLAVFMIDLDFFKAINDHHGHAYGDECLTRVAQELARQPRRPGDLIARYGGEEFVLLLPETDEHGARLVAERMRQTVYLLELENAASPHNKRLTVSVGVGLTSPQRGMSPGELLEVADQALYEAKRSGRNAICVKTL